MAIRSRRRAREIALRVLYEVEIGRAPVALALRLTLEESALTADQTDYAETLVNGIRSHLAEIDEQIAVLLRDYSFDRIAAVDRNLMRIAAFELLFLPAVPPAVTINEAVELAKKYSTAESGKFVNGVLGNLLERSPKADWNPALAPPEFEDAPEPEPEPEEPEVEMLEADSPEAKRLARVGGWTLRSPAPVETEPNEQEEGAE